jgi:uncharacterized protein
MRIWTAAVMAMALSGLAATDIAAQTKPRPGPAAAGQPSARQLALSRRYVELMQTDQLDIVIRSAVESSMSMDPDTTSIPPEDREFMIDLAAELAADLMPQMFDRLVPVYARAFSEEELLALIAFYDSDMGRSILSKTYSSMPEANGAMMTLMPQLFEKMATRICVRYQCDPRELLDEMGMGEGARTAGPPPK